MSNAIQIHVQIHQKALDLSSHYRRVESELIDVLEQVENHKVYLHYHHSSLFQYGVEELKLSESIIYRLITVMRKSKDIPKLRAEIKSGNITLSNATRIAPVITNGNQSEWLAKACTLSQRQLEKEVAKVRPQSAVLERATYVTSSRVKLELGLFEEHMLKFRRVQDLLCQSQSKNVTMEDAFIEMVNFYLHRQDPLLKAKRIFAKKGLNGHENDQGHADTDQLASRRVIRVPIKTALLHQVNLRDERRCTYLSPKGEPCNNSRFTEIHHRVAVAEGGKNTLENLTTLCSAHHRWLHRKMK